MIVKSFSHTDKQIVTSIATFRAKNPGRTTSSSEEEQKIHNDKYCSDGDISQWIVALEDDQVVGTVAVFSRDIRFNNQVVKLGGIGKVRVALDKRRKGVGSQVMKAAMKQLHENSVDVAFLCTDLESFLVEWYQRYGFEILPKEYTFVGTSGEKYVQNDGMLAPIRSRDIFEQIMSNSEILDLGKGNW